MNLAGYSALGKGVKITVSLSPSKWHANVTRKSYFASDQEIGISAAKIQFMLNFTSIKVSGCCSSLHHSSVSPLPHASETKAVEQFSLHDLQCLQQYF